jgi:PHS family inorganic phosphate transporter-like MFS transporter
MADTKWRGAMIAIVFAMQGFGQFVAAIMTLIVTVAFKSKLEKAKSASTCDLECQQAVDIMWRIVLGFGGVPGWFALYYRLTIPETPRYTFDVRHDLEKATADAQRYRSGKRGEANPNKLQQARTRAEMMKYQKPLPSLGEFFRYFSHWRNAMILFGTAGSWFFLDIAFYGLGLNSSTVLTTIGFSRRSNVYEHLRNTATGQLVLVCAGAIPGYWFTVFTVDILGRKPIQMGGFVILTILFAVIGFGFKILSEETLLALYILSQFFFNFGKNTRANAHRTILTNELGPNATTFIIPGECFPTRLRATAHGVSAAAGKIGAVIAQVAFAPLVNRGATPKDPHPWLNRVMQIFALFMLCGTLTSFLVPETKRRTLEELAGENHENLAYELQFRSGFFNNRHSRDSSRKRVKRASFGGMSQKFFRLSGCS